MPSTTQPSLHARYAWWIMAVLAVLVPALLWGGYEAFDNANNHFNQWLPRDLPETQTYLEFREIFGPDDFGLVSWDDCTLDDPRLPRLAAALCPPPGQRSDGSEYFAEVETGPSVLAKLEGEPFNLPRDEALRRLRGILVDAEGRRSGLLLKLSELGDRRRVQMLHALERIATERCDIPPGTLRLGGDAIGNAAFDIESERALTEWIALSVVVALSVAWLCLRSGRLTGMVLVVAAYSAVLGTAMVHFTGGTMNLVMVVMPVLIYVLTLSAAVHLANYYRDAIRHDGPDGAPQRALAMGWTPCTLSATTTALGVGSLYVSRVIPVRMFGVFSALGILVSLVILFVLLPAITETWPLRSAPARSGSDNPRVRRLAHWIVRYRGPISVVTVTLLLVIGSGVMKINTSMKPINLFSQQSRWVRDARWLEENIGPLAPLEVVVAFEPPSEERKARNFLGQMELVDRIQRSVAQLDYVGGTTSAATFAPDLEALIEHELSEFRGGPIRRSGAERLVRIRTNRTLLRNLDYFMQSGYLQQPEADRFQWRIGVRVAAFGESEYDELLAKLEQHIEQYLDEHEDRRDGVQVRYTGIVPLIFVAQRELLSGLFESFCLAFVLIAVVMVVLLRSFRAGLLAMLPNLFPALVTFGTMGWTGTLVDIGTMMTASVALGIAADDTLHYLTWFRRALAAGEHRQQAVITAYRHCASAMTHTTLIAGGGLIVFFLSSFKPVSQFGLLMCILLSAALVGDLVMLPALLATRLGRVFEKRLPNARNRLGDT